MSAQEEEPEQSPLGPEDLEAPDGLWTINIYDLGAVVSDQPTLEDATTLVDRSVARIKVIETPAVAADYEQVWDFTTKAWGTGELPYTETGDFFRWLRYDQGVPVITAAMLAGGAFLGLLLKYAEQHGYHPAKEPTFHQPKPLPTPTHGQRAVVDEAKKVVRQGVTAPGLTKAEASAITKAIGVASADLLKVQAALVDRMLPGMAPGQVPQALSQLNTADAILERQVRRLQLDVNAHAPGSLVGTVSSVSAAVTALQAAVAHLGAQLGAESPSVLLTDVHGLTARQDGFEEDLGRIEHELGGLATTAGLEALTAKVAVTVEELGLTHSSALDTALNGVEHSVAALKQQTDDNAECCEEASGITNPIRQGGATPSLLKQLGGILTKALEIGFLVTLADSALAVFDLPLAVSGVVADTETIETWATKAAGVITAEQTWLGKLSG